MRAWLLLTLLLVGGPAMAQEVTKDQTRAPMRATNTVPTDWLAPPVYRGASIASRSPDPGAPTSTKGVPLKLRNGVWWLTIELNGVVTIDCMLDTGAANVMVNEAIYDKLKSLGPLEEEATLRPTTLADGSQRLVRWFTMRSLRLGNVTVENIHAGVLPATAYPLLGQAFLERFKGWSIDTVKRELLLGEKITPLVAGAGDQIVPMSPRR